MLVALFSELYSLIKKFQLGYVHISFHFLRHTLSSNLKPYHYLACKDYNELKYLFPSLQKEKRNTT